MYPRKELMLIDAWPIFLKKSKCLFKTKVNNKKILEELEAAYLSKNEGIPLSFKCKQKVTRLYLSDVINIKTTRVLCAILKTGAIIKNKNSVVWKPTIIDAMDSICMEINSVTEMNEIISKKRVKYSNFSLKLQPIIFKLNNQENYAFQVIYDNIIYSFNNFIVAFDTCFKIFITLNLDFPVESKKVFYFIQKYFYDIKTNFDEELYHSDGEIINLIKDYTLLNINNC